MESFFFNITEQFYKITSLYKNKKSSLTRVDISNGVVFLDVQLSEAQTFSMKNLDRMMVIAVVKEGSIGVFDKSAQKRCVLEENSISMLLSSKQDIELTTQDDKKVNVFVLCVADFILKRYLSDQKNEVINHLYALLQTDISCELIDVEKIDAISLYIIEKILQTQKSAYMNGIICEQHILSFLIHRLELLEIEDTLLDDDEICISKSAKEILLKSFVNPPTIEVLAHLCATNTTKLKAVFKKRYKTTIYSYIQKLRLEHANLLLKEENLNIGEITKAVGYKHQGHFSKLFFQHYGVYPKELLKKSR